MNNFYPNVIASDYDVVAITETWLCPEVLSSEYFNSDFTVYRANGRGRGRGVLLAVRSYLISKEVPLTSPITDADLIGIQLSLSDNPKRAIINLYLPPALPCDGYDIIFDYLEANCALSDHILILGDFNIP